MNYDNLDSALYQIARDWKLDGDALEAFVGEDDIGGYHSDPSLARWPVGSMWAVEGQVLYALVRALKPKQIVEIGVHMGASTTHLRAAVRANGVGHVISIDKWAGAGSLIPNDLADYGTLIFDDGLRAIGGLKKNSVDFMFEDAIHSFSEVRDIWTAIAPKCRKGAMLASHDAMHPTEGEMVRGGVKAAGFDQARSYLIEPSDCGLILARTEWEMK